MCSTNWLPHRNFSAPSPYASLCTGVLNSLLSPTDYSSPATIPAAQCSSRLEYKLVAHPHALLCLCTELHSSPLGDHAFTTLGFTFGPAGSLRGQSHSAPQPHSHWQLGIAGTWDSPALPGSLLDRLASSRGCLVCLLKVLSIDPSHTKSCSSQGPGTNSRLHPDRPTGGSRTLAWLLGELSGDSCYTWGSPLHYEWLHLFKDIIDRHF